MSNKSGVSSQVLTLPSGGGALKGIGETFSPDLFTGTGNFTIPIELPPGRNGFQPNLSLVYSTGHGNGPFGLGWDLNVPGVSRKTSKGVPRYSDQPHASIKPDTFILSGAEDLVQVTEDGVMRFRPRTEGLFADIRRIHDQQNDFWRVRSKDGLVSLYGTPEAAVTDPAAIAHPTARSKVFSWMLSQTSDPFGNSIEYHYLRDSGSDGPHVWDQLYLQKVQYVDYEHDGQIDFLVSVTFIYEERPDKFSNYRAGFEIRTRLRCKRIEIRTHADQERLSRIYELSYLDERMPAEDLPRNGVSLLTQIKVVGHDQTQELPPLEFGYTRFAPEGRRFQPMQAVNSLPTLSLAADDLEIVGLFGNGLPDIVQMNGFVQFWRNLGNGQFDLPRTMNEVPADVELSDPGVQFADMNGDGRADLLALNKGGYFPLSFRGRWSPQGFVQYASSPSVPLGDDNLRLMDLDGDGVVDALRTGSSFELYFNDPRKGWLADAVEVRPRRPLEVFPDLNFSDARVKLADLNGDDLQDFVLVEQGQIYYWPYMGHGQWGGRVPMNNSPVFPVLPGELFDPKHVLLGDLDGDGLDDIIYITHNKLTCWINQGGEGWSDPIAIDDIPPPLTHIDGVRLTDMLGTGTAGVLWTFDQLAGVGSNYRFLDLTGGRKSYLLEQVDNHMGAVTRVQYAPSTKYYLEDQQFPKKHWKTPLPSPVQVVAKIEVADYFSRSKLTTEYHYHDGYWDGAEREFRGFGMVEQVDTEVFEAAHFSSPLLTKTWFHLGPIGDEFAERIEADLDEEYWEADPSVLKRPADTLKLMQSLPRSLRGDALRSLRGQILRTELYSLDGSDRAKRPYTVTESQYGIREVSPPAQGEIRRRRIFFSHRVAQRTTQWERGDQPMTQFSFTAQYDEYGQSQRNVMLAVARGRNYRLPAQLGERYLGTVTKIRYAKRDDSHSYIVDRVCETTSYEVSNDGSQTIFELYNQIQEEQASLKLIGQILNYYDGEAFVGLPLGQIGNYGALVRTESLVITPEILREAYRSGDTVLSPPEVPPYLLTGGESPTSIAEYPNEFRELLPALAGYVYQRSEAGSPYQNGYYAVTTRQLYDFHDDEASACGLLKVKRDPFEHDVVIDYDRYQLLPAVVTDPLKLTTRAEYDYRVLQPQIVTDPNGNQTVFTFTPLGLLETKSIKGKKPTEGDQSRPSLRMEYDFLAFENSPSDKRRPVFVKTIQYVHHDTETDVPLPERDETIETREYSDGFGRLIQTRTQGEEVRFGNKFFGGGESILPVSQSDGSGGVVIGERNNNSLKPNVVVSGWQIYDNKGRVVEKYEPFFDVGWSYEEPDDVRLGQKITMFYDPRGQIIKTLNPDGSEQRVIYGIPDDLANPEQFEPTPWVAYTYDSNDLARVSRNPDGLLLTNRAPEAHHFTPSHIVIDALGRTIESVARNRDSSNDPNQLIRTQTTYDIRGNVLTVTDALHLDETFRYTYDLANRAWRIESIDAGLRRTVLDVMGNEIERRDSKGAIVLQSYDILLRPIRLWARDNTDANVTLRQRLEYGDGGRPDQDEQERETKRSLNLLGQLHRHHDEAGLTTVEVIDFKGNVLEKTRRVIADTPILAAFHQGQATGWKITPFVVDWQIAPGQQLADREAELLEPAAHRTTSSFDALNRIKGMHFPEDVEGRRRELRPEYNRAGGLDRVWLDETLYVERIAYDAKGQRSLIAYGNGVMTRYAYDPQTFRLKRLRSEHYFKPDDLTYHPNGEAFQDFGYDYDLVGNITALRDRAPHSGFLNNAEALTTSDQDLRSLLINGDALNRRFSYDAIYRLRSANGRECDLPPDSPWDDRPRCTDLNRCRGYREQYLYDLMGNILRLRHHDPNGANGNGFTREFTIDSANNRLSKTQIGSGSYSYKFDDNGNMKSETSTRHFEWNHSDEMKVFRTQTDGAQPSVYAQCLYDASGQRVKKFVRKQNGDVEVTDYIDGVFEHHRWAIQSQVGENNHVHMMDDQQRIALKRIGPAHPDDRGPAVQFHLGDYLGSSNVVVDSTGAFVNREEFTPYGETSFGNFAKKRYRFTGKERDEESGLNYHGARYYAPWLGVWIACDPLVVDKRLNLYMYGDNSPLRLVDVTGQSPQEQEVFPYSEEIRQKCKIKQKTFTLRRQNKASTKSKDGPQARKAVAKSGVGVQKTEGEPGRDTGSDGDPKTDRQKTSGLDAHESQESRTATGLDEIIYGGEKLFLHTDMAMADFWPTLLAPFSWDWPVVAKVFYAIALPPMFVLSSFVSVGLHVIGSIENIVGGAVRLTFEILEGAWDFLSERLSPTIVQPIYPEISEGLNEPFSFPETYKVTAQESPPPPARQEATAPKRSPKAHINPPSDWIRHGCSYGPDLP